MNFNNYDDEEIAREFLDIDTRNLMELLNEAGDGTIYIVETFAEANNLIDSEEALSELFDEEIAPLVIEQYGENDIPAMSESFNNWSDSLCKDGELHSIQYHEYCYVGKYSN